MFFVFIAGLLFICFRAKQYFDDRKARNHDTYMVVKGGEYKKCPDLDMLGFKFSVMLAFMALNLFATVILLMST
jgi:hypothetical protein